VINEPQVEGLRQQPREPVRMLLVEDDPQFADLVQTQLRRMPWVESRLEVAATLAQALEKLAKGRFGLVLTDLNLPDSKGVATIDALARSGEQLVIVLTGDATPTLRASALECGAYDFLHKDSLSAAALERQVRLASLQANTFRSLRETEARFRSLVALSSDWYWEQDEELRFTRFEGGVTDGFRREAFGRRRWEIARLRAVSCTWEEHRATLEARRPFRNFQYSRVDDAGVLRFVSASGEPVFDAGGGFVGYRGLATDVTERERAEEETRRFRLALDTTPDMILLIDREEMRHVDANTTACRLLGYSREELLALGPQDVLPLAREELERLYDAMIADPSRVTGMRGYYRCRDGSRLPFESTRRVLKSGGRWIISVISRDIRQHLAAERALRESEARKAAILDASTDAIVTMDHGGRVIEFNRAAERHFGYARDAVVGRDMAELIVPPELRERHRQGLARYLASGEGPVLGKTIEVPALRADGSRFEVELTIVRIPGSEPALFTGTARDITARKDSERELRRLERINVAIAEANEAVLRARSVQEVFVRACDVAVAAGGFQLVTVFSYDGASGRLTRRAASGPAAARLKDVVSEIDLSQPEAQGLLAEACRSGQPAISNDYASDPNTEGRRSAVPEHRVGSAAAFPLRAGDGVAGVLGMQHPQPNAFSEELNALLQHLAENISFALETFRREAARRKAKRGLRESEARFRSLTGLSSDIYWEQDAHYRFTQFSGASVALDDAGRARMIGKRRWDTHYFNMTEVAWEAHRADLEAHRAFHDLELGRVNEAGEKIWVSVSGEPIFDDAGAFKGYRGIGKDITRRKRAAQLRELEHSVTRYLSQADSLEAALRGAIRAVCETEAWDCGRYFTADARTVVLRFSYGWGVDDEAVQRFLAGSGGLVYGSGEGLCGRVWQTAQPLWVTDVSEDPRSAHSELALASGMHGAFVFPVIAEGRVIGVLAFDSRHLRQSEDALLQAIGVIGSQIGQFVQRKQAEEEVRKSASRFRSLTELSSDWYWEQDAEFRFTAFEGKSAGGRYMPTAAVLGKRVWELEGVEAESPVWEAHRASLERHQSFHQFEYSYRDRAGNRYYVSADGEPVFDTDGGFAGYRGTSRDVTAQRRGEEELRRFRAAMDMSIDAIYLVDRASMRFLDVNEAACRGVGYSREQLLAMGPADLLKVPRAEIERVYDEVIARSPEGVMAENSYVGANGRVRWTELHRRALRAGDGWIIVSVSRDITERKLSEQRQGEHLRYQERIARFGQSALLRRDPGELVEKAVQAVLEALGAEAVAYLESEPGVEGLVLRALVGVADAGAPPGTLACGPGTPLGQVLQSGARVLTDGAQLPLAWSRGLRSAALVPVRGGDKVRGVLCIAYREADAFAAEALNFVDAAASVLSAALQRIDSESRLAYLAQFDALTGLPNRALLADRFSQMIGQARRRSSALAALFIDLDGFKLVNDTLGHAGGDALLKETAVRLQASVRTGDTVARISGDEFAVVLADLARLEDAALVAQKVIDRLAEPFDVHGKEVFVTASVGIAVFPGDGADAESLIGAADAAMYRAKQSGRNAFQFFTAEINQRSRARAQLGVELHHAVEREEFELAYQPKIDLGSRRPTGAEALLRWKHPRRGMVSPVEFIPVLEETGLIIAVGDWVLRRACEDLKAWQAGGLAALPISVNLSARQFRQQDLDARIKGIVGAAGIDPALIELEITESQLMQDPDQAIRVMRALRDAGMRIAIDDFGTGYSSLAYLTRFPVAALKIDRSFVKEMSSDQGDATIVRTIIEMAHTLGFTVVAEGVETEQQANFLRLLRCEQAQGYLFARPMPAAELAAFFQKGG
jgi:diguanylate cyclase (GGDEF)-like protein/PAS domain S-box-containing protein